MSELKPIELSNERVLDEYLFATRCIGVDSPSLREKWREEVLRRMSTRSPSEERLREAFEAGRTADVLGLESSESAFQQFLQSQKGSENDCRLL